MKLLTKLVNFLLVFALSTCATALPTPAPEINQVITDPYPQETLPIPPPPNKDVPVVLLRSENPNFALTALFEDHSTITAMTKTDDAGKIIDVTGAIFTAPDSRSIVVYFEDALPVRAIADGYMVEFYNYTDTSVDIAVVAPDGTVTNQTEIPFDRQRIKAFSTALAPGQSSGHLARTSFSNEHTDFDWMLFASTALGAFSCAATIATGGTLGILFGVSCGIFIYTTYFQITEKEPPVLLDVPDQAAGLVSCGADVMEKKYVMAAADCGKLVIDQVEPIQKQSTITYEKQRKVLEEYNLKSGKKPIGRPMACPDLAPMECANLGKHSYQINTVVNRTKGCRAPFDEVRHLDTSFNGDSVTIEGVWWYGKLTFTRVAENSYEYEEESWLFNLSFTENGFTIQEKSKPEGYCTWDHTFERIP